MVRNPKPSWEEAEVGDEAIGVDGSGEVGVGEAEISSVLESVSAGWVEVWNAGRAGAVGGLG